MKTAAAIFLALATIAGAQWSTSVWPSYSYPMESRAQQMDIHSAAVERCWAAGVSLSSLKWYQSQYDNLTNMKHCLKTAIPFYIVTNGFEGNLSSVLDSNALTHYAVPDLLNGVKVPTNLLDYTPWSNFSGCGPFTNEGLAWGNGYTNQWTAAGGTNFPTGRTSWYTTDYGYMLISNVFPPLVWVKAKPEMYVDIYLASGFKTNLTESKEQAATNRNYFGAAVNLLEWGSYIYLNGPYYDSKLYYGVADVTTFSTPIIPPIKCDADFYAKCIPADFLFEGCVFTNFGDTNVSESFIRFDQIYNAASSNVVSEFGSTNPPFPDVWGEYDEIEGKSTPIGWELSANQFPQALVIILKLDGTNGFRYR